jgi:hypothetical protein
MYHRQWVTGAHRAPIRGKTNKHLVARTGETAPAWDKKGRMQTNAEHFGLNVRIICSPQSRLMTINPDERCGIKPGVALRSGPAVEAAGLQGSPAAFPFRPDVVGQTPPGLEELETLTRNKSLSVELVCPKLLVYVYRSLHLDQYAAKPGCYIDIP